MRIYYCLTSLELDKNVPRQNRHLADLNDNAKLQFLQKYSLTMIEITEQPSFNYVEYSADGLPEKNFYFIFERNNEERKKIKLKPGSISVKNIDWENGIIDLEFAAYELLIWNPHFKFNQSVKSMRIRNIKNTPNKLVITDEEKTEYEKYLADIDKYLTRNSSITKEEAMNKIKMPMSGTKKVLRQKITDIKDAIEFFCDPTKEKIDEIPENSRFIGSTSQTRYVEIETQKEYHWRKKKPKDSWNYLIFDNIIMTRFDNEWFEAINLTKLKINDCKFMDLSKKAWDDFASGISKLEKLQELQISANLEDIPDTVFQKLPKSLTNLNLSRNQLKAISPDISCLTNLDTLILDDNPLLTDIPWKSLPSTIKWLLLENTGISEIPSDIEQLIHLSQLGLKNTDLQNVTWNSITKTLHSISLQSVKNLNEIFYASQITSLQFYDTDLRIFPWEIILNFRGNGSRQLSVNLSYNKITVLGHPRYWRHLENLDVRKNEIKEIFIDELDFDGNEETNLEMSLDLSKNPLTSLPFGFEKLVGISQLSVSETFIQLENIDETLWQRLPPSLTILNLNDLHVSTLPCKLKIFPLKEIYAAGCNLHWKCPQISKIPSLQYLDTSNNPSLKSLSFVPQKPHLYPRTSTNKKDVEFTERAAGVAEGIKIPQTEDFTIKPLKLMTDKTFRNTERASAKNLHYKFDSLLNLDQINACLCCARCGETTHVQMIEQLMTMDMDLYEFNESKNPEDSEWNRDLWISKKWKTKVVTRLCESCKEWFKIEAKKVVEIHRAKLEKTKKNCLTIKRKPMEKENRKKRIKMPGEEDSDEESEEDEFESEESVLSDDDDNDVDHENQHFGIPLTIGSTITLPWPPIIHYAEPPLLPSINTIYGNHGSENVNYQMTQPFMPEPPINNSFSNNIDEQNTVESSEQFQHHYYETQFPAGQEQNYITDSTLANHNYYPPQQYHHQRNFSTPLQQPEFEPLHYETPQQQQLSYLPSYESMPTNSFQLMNIGQDSNQTYFEPQQHNYQQQVFHYQDIHPNEQHFNPEQPQNSEFYNSRKADGTFYPQL